MVVASSSHSPADPEGNISEELFNIQCQCRSSEANKGGGVTEVGLSRRPLELGKPAKLKLCCSRGRSILLKADRGGGPRRSSALWMKWQRGRRGRTRWCGRPYEEWIPPPDSSIRDVPQLLHLPLLSVDDVDGVAQVHQGGRGHEGDLQDPVMDVGDREPPVVAGVFAPRFVAVAVELGHFVLPDVVQSGSQDKDPEQEEDAHPDLPNHRGVRLDLVQQRGHAVIMGEWSFLSDLLDKVQSHSTVGGKVWLSVLFLFRIFILAAGVDKIWGDEQSNMECNTLSVGCKNACYDRYFPLSHTRFWVIQILMVSTPTVMYLGHVLLVIRRENKLRRRIEQKLGKIGMNKAPKYSDEFGRVQLKGVLLVSYLMQVLFKILLEVAFIVGQYYLYGFILMPLKITFSEYPCPSQVNCFISRPTEKTIFILFMLAMAVLSVILNIIEMFHLMISKEKENRESLARVEEATVDLFCPDSEVSGSSMQELGFKVDVIMAEDVPSGDDDDAMEWNQSKPVSPVQVQPLQQDLTLDLILLRGGVGERGEQRVDVSQQSTALTEECIVVETWAQRKIKKCY
ncbi:hypothetical protein F7725_019187 [Dissostichus mawsoni]|uniref:Gap junction protein n=1 Tax=Dissostichus mawsoni TaxID=36200 RepID=A0A7J5YMC8_DISMA|nr:hypothetical protein F7725_019187 [Dissostichus mawsoni]